MASGATVTDNVKKICKDIQVLKSAADPSERIRLLRFGFDDKGNIDVLECYRQKELGGKDAFSVLKEIIEKMKCGFFLYDCYYETKETKKEQLIFILWSDDNSCGIKDKMKFASSKDALKKSIQGIKHEVQANDRSVFQTRKTFAEAAKLEMISLEGVTVDP